MNRLCLLLIVLLGVFKMSAQDIVLEKNTKQVIIKPNAYMHIGVISPDSESYCNQVIYTGLFKEIVGDSIFLDIDKSVIKYTTDDIYKEETTQYNPSFTGRQRIVHKDDVRYMNVFKNKRSLKKKKGFKGVGALLIFTGITTGISYFLVKKESKSTILAYSGAQIGSGILCLILGREKEYKFEGDTEDVWMLK